MDRSGSIVLAAIAGGSALGGVARHLLTEAVTQMAGAGFPWGTLLVNVLGSGVIGAAAALSAGSASWTPLARHAAMTGVLGGFTTFSTFSVQTMALLQQGQLGAATANVLLSVLLGVVGCWTAFAAVTALAR